MKFVVDWADFSYVTSLFIIVLAKQILATQAQKAILCLKRLQFQCGYLPVNAAIKLFDEQISWFRNFNDMNFNAI